MNPEILKSVMFSNYACLISERDSFPVSSIKIVNFSAWWVNWALSVSRVVSLWS